MAHHQHALKVMQALDEAKDNIAKMNDEINAQQDKMNAQQDKIKELQAQIAEYRHKQPSYDFLLQLEKKYRDHLKTLSKWTTEVVQG